MKKIILAIICILSGLGFMSSANQSDVPKKLGYRAFPETIKHPSQSQLFSMAEFNSMDKIKIQEAPSVSAGHTKTIVWYSSERGYILEILFEKNDPVFIHSICTFTPSLGMDRIDGEFAQDAEEYILEKTLNRETNRLNVFENKNEISIQTYLERRGIIKQ